MNFNFLNFNIDKILIKLGFKKQTRIGIEMKNVSDVKMKRVKTSGYDKGLDIENASDVQIEDVEHSVQNSQK